MSRRLAGRRDREAVASPSERKRVRGEADSWRSDENLDFLHYLWYEITSPLGFGRAFYQSSDCHRWWQEETGMTIKDLLHDENRRAWLDFMIQLAPEDPRIFHGLTDETAVEILEGLITTRSMTHDGLLARVFNCGHPSRMTLLQHLQLLCATKTGGSHNLLIAMVRAPESYWLEPPNGMGTEVLRRAILDLCPPGGRHSIGYYIQCDPARAWDAIDRLRKQGITGQHKKYPLARTALALMVRALYERVSALDAWPVHRRDGHGHLRAGWEFAVMLDEELTGLDQSPVNFPEISRMALALAAWRNKKRNQRREAKRAQLEASMPRRRGQR
jgi:hypothetical protein